MKPPEVTQYGAGLDGTRAVSVHLDGAKVLVSPAHATDNETALALAQRIATGEQTVAEQAARIAELEGQARRIRGDLRQLRATHEAALTGRRRFFGPVLMKPARAGEWGGEVWLVDPEKRERGRALVYANAAEVRALHPELWVVGVVDGGVLLDAWGLTVQPPEDPEP